MDSYDMRILKQLKFFLQPHSRRQLWKQWNKYLWMCSNENYINYAKVSVFMRENLSEHEMNIIRNRKM